MKSLDEFNRTARNRHAVDSLRIHVRNGIACPECGEELVDDQPHVTLTSDPPQKSVYCFECDYHGYRVA